MIGYVDNIENQTVKNTNFRHVLFTSTHVQLVVMHLAPGEDIGVEVHDHVDQFFRIEEGEGKVIMNGEEHVFGPGFAIIVPAGTQHNIINTSSTLPLKLYTLYSPPNHKDGTIHKTRQEAMADEEDHIT